MIKKMLSSIGIGSAKVDTQLVKDSYLPGEQIEGIVMIKGGNVEQKIDEIYITLMTTYIKERNDQKVRQTAILEKFKLSEPITINPQETKEIPFRFPLPNNTPITQGNTRVWLQTGLDIKQAIDPQDNDYIEVKPHPLVHAFLGAVRGLGFRIREVECKSAPWDKRRQYPFVQEFEFVPTSGSFRGRLDELEATFFVDENHVEVLLQIDRKVRGLGSLLSEAMNMDETHLSLRFGTSDVPELPQKLTTMLERYS